MSVNSDGDEARRIYEPRQLGAGERQWHGPRAAASLAECIRAGIHQNGRGSERLGHRVQRRENGGLIITDRIPAAAALHYGLGAEQAARLPGHFGALFVAPSDVGQLLPVLEAVLERPSPEMLARARSWLKRGNNESVHPEALFSFIPRALRTAQARREGVLLLTVRG